MVVCFQHMWGGWADINILVGPPVGCNQAPQADHASSQLLVVHGASTPKITGPFRGFVPVLFSPCVLTPSEGISNRVRAGSRGSMLLVILCLSFSSLLGQSSLDLMLANLLRLPSLLFLLGGLFVPFLLHDVIQDSLCGHLLFVSKCIPHTNITHMHNFLSDTFLLGLSRGNIGIGGRRALRVKLHNNGWRQVCTNPNVHISLISPSLPGFLWYVGWKVYLHKLSGYDTTLPNPSLSQCLVCQGGWMLLDYPLHISAYCTGGRGAYPEA